MAVEEHYDPRNSIDRTEHPMPDQHSSETQPPSFAPSSDILSSYAASIFKALTRYSSASSSEDKAAALSQLAQHAQELTRAATDPVHAVEEFMNYPVAHACVRIAGAMGIFEFLPPGGPATVQRIALATGAEEDFTLRIMRALAAVGMIQQVDEESYAHTPMSRMWADPTVRGAFTYWDDSVQQMSHLTRFFDLHGFRSPSDPMNSPAAFAAGEKDVDVFTLMARTPASEVFNETMAVASQLAAKEVCNTFRFDTLEAGEGGVALVDVGGGKGQMLKEILHAFPDMQGRVVLEDLEAVLHSGTVVLDERVELRPYNFFEGAQPITGKSSPFQA